MKDILLKMLPTLVTLLSPHLLEMVREVVAKGLADAKDTTNPFDDILFGVLQFIVGKPGDPAPKEATGNPAGIVEGPDNG